MRLTHNVPTFAIVVAIVAVAIFKLTDASEVVATLNSDKNNAKSLAIINDGKVATQASNIQQSATAAIKQQTNKLDSKLEDSLVALASSIGQLTDKPQTTAIAESKSSELTTRDLNTAADHKKHKYMIVKKKPKKKKHKKIKIKSYKKKYKIKHKKVKVPVKKVVYKKKKTKGYLVKHHDHHHHRRR